MNTAEDWDVIWRWQWFRRPLWLPYFRDPTHPEGRPARLAPVWNWVLAQSGAHRVLDCNCGLGLRAVLLAESGFEVVGTDSSAVAIRHAPEVAATKPLSIPFVHCPWQSLAERFTEPFDAIINDAFSLTPTRTELRFAALNFATLLRPGGVLIFTGADEHSNPEEREAQIEHAWQSAPRYQLGADYEHDGTHLILLIVRDRAPYGVVDNHVFIVRRDGRATLETASICNSMQWTWDDYHAVCREAGFSSLESVRVPVGRRQHVLNVARR